MASTETSFIYTVVWLCYNYFSCWIIRTSGTISNLRFVFQTNINIAVSTRAQKYIFPLFCSKMLISKILLLSWKIARNWNGRVIIEKCLKTARNFIWNSAKVATKCLALYGNLKCSKGFMYRVKIPPRTFQENQRGRTGNRPDMYLR